ncbi:MAG: nicotinate phosphoribosyltransferase, partial [candidate division WOR-3 bacterium]
ALIDTFGDEKFESLKAAETIRDLIGVRLDTPSSRRGNFSKIVREVRWELDLRGFSHVKIFVSGGIDEDDIPALKEAGAYGFGVGTSISNAPTIDYAMDIVEIEGKAITKKGKFSGRKMVFRCPKCLNLRVIPGANETLNRCDLCGVEMEPFMNLYLENGKRTCDLPDAAQIRSFVLSQLEKFSV